MNEVAIKLRIESLEEGGFVATSPDVPGLVAEGRSITEAVEIAAVYGFGNNPPFSSHAILFINNCSMS